MDICELRSIEPFEFIDAIVKLLKDEDYKVQTSILPQLGRIMNCLNVYFKNKILGDLWDLEKFSLKESQ